MNEEQFKGKWSIAKGTLKQKYADLTDDDLKYAEGKSDELLGRIQEKTGESKEKLKKMINDL
ncbi:CsbD family protein [uncultured Maribacter sp.]|uniref:CsbD family protein n=1 Tax=uncultured Maribacter sp. TaxID=431308 RepID=UPI0030DCD5CF|tara:strand:+ start:2522 stop:2707 length:186 start_codon:yes stop_codon:yes gene_type:complete